MWLKVTEKKSSRYFYQGSVKITCPFCSYEVKVSEKRENKILYVAGFYWSVSEDISIFLDLMQTLLTVQPNFIV